MCVDTKAVSASFDQATQQTFLSMKRMACPWDSLVPCCR